MPKAADLPMPKKQLSRNKSPPSRGYILPGDILARMLRGEARGETLAGQIAVARTIRNHVNVCKA
jgi:spore germination cell wall hydrolase CwlJ-like protein